MLYCRKARFAIVGANMLLLGCVETALCTTEAQRALQLLGRVFVPWYFLQCVAVDAGGKGWLPLWDGWSPHENCTARYWCFFCLQLHVSIHTTGERVRHLPRSRGGPPRRRVNQFLANETRRVLISLLGCLEENPTLRAPHPSRRRRVAMSTFKDMQDEHAARQACSGSVSVRPRLPFAPENPLFCSPFDRPTPQPLPLPSAEISRDAALASVGGLTERMVDAVNAGTVEVFENQSAWRSRRGASAEGRHSRGSRASGSGS